MRCAASSAARSAARAACRSKPPGFPLQLTSESSLLASPLAGGFDVFRNCSATAAFKRSASSSPSIRARSSITQNGSRRSIGAGSSGSAPSSSGSVPRARPSGRGSRNRAFTAALHVPVSSSSPSGSPIAARPRRTLSRVARRMSRHPLGRLYALARASSPAVSDPIASRAAASSHPPSSATSGVTARARGSSPPPIASNRDSRSSNALALASSPRAPPSSRSSSATPALAPSPSRARASSASSSSSSRARSRARSASTTSPTVVSRPSPSRRSASARSRNPSSCHRASARAANGPCVAPARSTYAYAPSAASARASARRDIVGRCVAAE